MHSTSHATRKRWTVVCVIVAVAALLVPLRSTFATDRPDADGNNQPDTVGNVRQAYFFHPAGESVEDLKANGDILFFGLQDHKVIRKLRESNYNRPVMAYLLAAELEGAANAKHADSECSTSVDPWDNSLASEPGLFCREVHPNEDWFLHNSKGQRLTATQSGYGGTHVYYYMNPGNAGFRDWMTRRMVQSLQGETAVFTGIFLDNVELSLEKVNRQLKLSDGSTQEYAKDADYRAAWVGYLKQLSDALRPNKQIWGNMIADPYDGSAWDAYMDYLDGGLAEAFAAGWPKSRFSPARWERHMEQLSKVLARGKAVTGVTQGDKGSDALMDFGVGCYMLIAQGERTYYRYSQYADYGNWHQSQSFQYDLGNPLGERYKQNDGKWRRDFEKGYVVVDPKNFSAQVISQNMKNTGQPSSSINRVFVPIVAQPTGSQTTSDTTEASIEPIEASIEPVEASIEPIEASIEPIETSIEPIEASIESTETSIELIEASIEPVEASIEPTETTSDIQGDRPVWDKEEAPVQP